MNAIRASLLCDHNIDLSERNMQHKVWREVKDHIPFYVEFTVNKTQDEVLHDVNKYLRSYGKKYTLPIIDVIVGACTNSLNINIKIFENHQGFKKEIDFEPEKNKSPLSVYLLYSRDAIPAKDVHNANAHYDAIVLKKKNNDGDESAFQLREDDNILKPSQLFTTARPQLHPDLAKYNVTEEDIFHMDMTVFKGMAGKIVGVKPYGIDGDIMYTVKCKKNQWHAKQLDGHYWATSTGKNKKLRKIGITKVSRCKGNLVCKNKKCTMYMAHQVSNALNFETIQDEYRCKHCNQFAKRDWCGLQKAVEYNNNTETMTMAGVAQMYSNTRTQVQRARAPR